MIDRVARDNLAERLRQYRDGEITGDDLMSSVPHSGDAAVSGINERYSRLLIGCGDGHPEEGCGSLRVTELECQAGLVRGMNRAILFLQTDLGYRWRDRPLLGDPTLVPFQLIAFLICMSVVSFGVLYLEEALSVNEGLLAAIMVPVLTIGTLVGGSRLRSLFTGIDRFVWPFYRRQDYRNALHGIGAATVGHRDPF